MPTYTIYANINSNDTYTTYSYDGNLYLYSNAPLIVGGNSNIDKYGTHTQYYESFIKYSASSIASGETIVSASMSYYFNDANTPVTNGWRSAKKDWGSTVDVTDFVSNVASVSDYANVPSGTYTTGTMIMSGTSLLLTDLAARGNINVVLLTLNQDYPLNANNAYFAKPNDNTIANRPKLTVVTTAASSPTVYNLIVTPL
jgi:hypothetical protein